MPLYKSKYYAEHREAYQAYNRKYNAKRKEKDVEYHHHPPKTKSGICNYAPCSKVLGFGRYNEHYCSRECYFHSFDIYRPPACQSAIQPLFSSLQTSSLRPSRLRGE
jgi:hypothetical protein